MIRACWQAVKGRGKRLLAFAGCLMSRGRKWTSGTGTPPGDFASKVICFAAQVSPIPHYIDLPVTIRNRECSIKGARHSSESACTLNVESVLGIQSHQKQPYQSQTATFSANYPCPLNDYSYLHSFIKPVRSRFPSMAFPPLCYPH